MKNKFRGFTLIELLVVIAIIGILSALLMTNFIGIRQRARDGQRKSDLRQIQSALEMYRADQSGYPATASLVFGSPLVAGTSTYMQKVPLDSINTGKFVYQYSGSNTAYCLRACLENTNDSQKDSTNNPSITGCSFSISCTGGTTDWSYSLQNP